MTALAHEPDHTAAGVAEQSSVADLRTLIAAALADLAETMPQVELTIDTRAGRPVFLSVEARKVLDDLARQERRDRVRHAHERIVPTGTTPMPGSPTAVSLAAEYSLLVALIYADLVRRATDAGAVIVGTWPTDRVAPAELHPWITHLVGYYTNPRGLRGIHTDLETLATRARQHLEGKGSAAVPDPCPWCHRDTLVAHFSDGIIRCERDPHTGRYETCLCSDSYCDCKTRRRHRHEWHRDQKSHKSTSWHGLRRHQHSNRKATP